MALFKTLAVRAQFQTAVMEVLQSAEALQPALRPVLLVRPTPCQLDEIAALMCPGDSQHELACFDLGHGLVSLVPIHDHNALRVGAKRVLGDFTAAAQRQYKDDDFVGMEAPQLPPV